MTIFTFHRKQVFMTLLVFLICLGFAVTTGLRKELPGEVDRKLKNTQAMQSTRQSVDEQTRAKVLENFGQTPLHFEPNNGQINNDEVRFTSRGQGYNLFLSSAKATLALSQAVAPKTSQKKEDSLKLRNIKQLPDRTREIQDYRQALVEMQIVGANEQAESAGREELEGRSNYYIGNDPTKWRTDVANYKRVRFDEVYEGIDLEYYGNQRQLEYDFIVEPNANPDRIKLQFKGVKKIKVDATSGELILQTPLGEIRQKKPFVYQTDEATGERWEIKSSYRVKEKEVSFSLGEYDRTKHLVIDPIVIAYSTFLGGSGRDYGIGIAVDPAGNAFVTGYTSSLNFPRLNAWQNNYGGGDDAYLTKFSPTGALLFSTYLGGISQEIPPDIALDSAGNIYITGDTLSSNFPVFNARQASYGGAGDAFLAKFNPNGVLLFSTYHGGGDFDYGIGIKIDSTDKVYITGQTRSTQNFPLLNARQETHGGGYDGFVSKFDSNGNLLFSTYHGGTGNDSGNGIDTDVAGNVYVSGWTNSISNFPILDARQPAFGGGNYDSYLSSLSSDGVLLFSTYHGGAATDESTGLAVDLNGNVYIVGATSSPNFPILNARQSTLGGGQNDGFISKFSPGGSLLYSTYQGGLSPNYEYISDIAINSAGEILVTGHSDALDFPVLDARSSKQGNTLDVFISKLSPTGVMLWSTFHGGTNSDYAGSIIVDSAGNIYVTGSTYSITDFPILNASQNTYGGDWNDAFVTKFNDNNPCSYSPISFGQTLNGQLVTSDCNITGRYAESYTFSGTAGQQISFSLDSANFDGYLVLLDRNEQVLLENNDGGGGTNSRLPSGTGFYTLPATGSYSVRVVSYSPASVGNYSVSLAEQLPGTCNYTLSSSTFNIPAAGNLGQTFTVTTTPECGWTAVKRPTDTWIDIKADAQSGNGTVILTVAPNSANARSTTITVGGKTVTINQAAASTCQYVFRNPLITSGPNGGLFSSQIVTRNDCSWTAVSTTPSWLTITTVPVGTGTANIEGTIAPNSGTALRTGAISINNGLATLTVNQDFFASNLLSLRDYDSNKNTSTNGGRENESNKENGLVPGAVVCSYALPTQSVQVPANESETSFSLSAAAGCPWTAVSNSPDWLEIVSERVFTGTIVFQLRAKTNTGAAPRSGQIAINGGEHVFTVIQVDSSAISVAVQSNPPGRSFTVDGTNYTTAQTFYWIPGSNHTIATTSPQAGSAGTRYVWSNWSDGGAISHTVTPTTTTTFTANFTTQYQLTMNAGANGTVSPASGGFYNAGQVVQISATPNAGYTFNGWTGSGSGSYTGTNNPASVTMNGPITQTGTFIVLVCTYSLSPAGRGFLSSGGTATVQVTAQPTCAWTAVSNLIRESENSARAQNSFSLISDNNWPLPFGLSGESSNWLNTGIETEFSAISTASIEPAVDWINITSGQSGTGNGTVTYSVAPNTTGNFRNGSMTIGGQIFPVFQSFNNAPLPGSLDTTFDGDGRAVTPVGSSHDLGRAVVTQPDGKLVVAGYSSNGTNYDFAVVRYNANGLLDTSFDGDGKVTTPIGNSDDSGFAVALQADGKIVVAGASQNGTNYDFALVRYNTNGSLDTSFDGDGKAVTPIGSSFDVAYSVVIQPDGSILAGGGSNNGTNMDFALVRYNADGSLDMSFDGDGKVVTPIGNDYDLVNDLALQTDGKIVAAGISNNGANMDFALARYTVDGSLDPSFDGDGKVITPLLGDDYANGVAIQTDGKIVAAGFTPNSGTYDIAVVRYNTDGSLDTTFDSDGKVITAVGPLSDAANEVAVQSDKIIVAGYSNNGTSNDFAVVRYNANGSLDTSFDGDGKVTVPIGSSHDEAVGLAIQTDGKIVAVGYYNNGSNNDFAVARFNGLTLPANGKIAYQSNVGNDREIWTMNGDGTNKVNITNSPSIDGQPNWSPDGSKIAFSTQRNGNFDIYTMNLDGSNPIQLTTDTGNDGWPAWSPDGSKIAFSSLRDGDEEIFVMNADGTGQTQLTFNSSTDSSPSWSPNGTQIVFAASRDGNPEIYRMNANGSNQIRLTNNPSDDLNPAWSAVGTKILFNSNRSGNKEVFMMSPDGFEQTGLTSDSADDYDSVWSPDMTKVAFISTRHESFGEVYTMNLNATGVTRLTNNTDIDGYLAWQPLKTTGGTIPITVQTNPADLSYTVDGTNYTSTQTFNWTPGSAHTVATTSPQAGSAGTRYVWSNWSDGGAISHTVTPTTTTTFTANFTTQYQLTMNAGANGTVSPASGGFYNAGQVVQISATPNAGYTFNGWTGSGSGSYTGTNNPASVTMNAPITQTAAFCNFAINPESQNIGSNGGSLIFKVVTLAGCSWNAITNDSWINITQGSGSGSGQTLFTVAPNTSNSQRTATITVPGQTHTVIQAGATMAVRSPFDFDGDGKSDISIFRPSNGQWWLGRSSQGVIAHTFGNSSDKITPADFTGDGQTDVAIFRPSSGEWFILRSEDFTFYSFPFGNSTDIPAPADYDGDNKADAAVFRSSNSTWYIQRSTDNGTTIQQFGASGDKPVPSDYDGDGKADIAIYRPSLGQWWLNRSSLGVIAVTFGNSTDKPVQGDYTGDGKSDIAIWRPSNGEWFILRSENFTFYSFPFGASGDTPVPGDYDGDGKFDGAVFRPSNATWYLNRTTAGTLIRGFGLSTDLPVPAAFGP